MAVKPGLGRQLFQTIGSLRTGIILLIIVGIVSAAGTVILQRGTTSSEEIERAYSPRTLQILDATGLTDVYHTWWFLTLLGLLALSIILVSLDRWPNAWRYYSRPYRRTDASFRAVLPLQKSVPVSDPAEALDAAERALKKHGLKPERMVEHNEVSLYAEKSRFAVLAVYIVHAGLLLIMVGGVVDKHFGYKGFVNLVPGQKATATIDTPDGKSTIALPFAVRCDGAGQENYTGEFAGMPKRWWSNLTVEEGGRETYRKQIEVNEPLVYRGVRFYQANFGQSGTLDKARLVFANTGGGQKVIDLEPQASAQLDDGTTVKLMRFIPNAYLMDGGVYQRSKELGNPAIEVEVTAHNAQAQTFWLFPSDQQGMRQIVLVGPYDATGRPAAAPYQIQGFVKTLPFTGLQVSYEPGQWAIWGGCIAMAIGMFLAFWVLHQRYWIVPVTNKEGRLVLWMGAAANKNREGFAVRFRELTDEVEKQLQAEPAAGMAAAASAVRS